MEIITGRERRPPCSDEAKQRIVAETYEPGVRVRTVAVRHGVCESLVSTWRRQVRDGLLTAPEMPVFLSVQVYEAPLSTGGALRRDHSLISAPAAPPSLPRPQAGLIEIELGRRRQVRGGSDVNLAALRRVLTALRG